MIYKTCRKTKLSLFGIIFFFWFWWEKNFYLWAWLWNWPLIQMDEETHSCSLQSANILRLQCVIKHSVCIECSQWVNSSMALWTYTMATQGPPGLQVFFKSCKEFNFNGRQLSTKLGVGSSSLESHYRHQVKTQPCHLLTRWFEANSKYQFIPLQMGIRVPKPFCWYKH